MAVGSLTERSGATAAVDGRKLGAALWIVQGLLALVFLGTGIMKLTAPSEMLAAQVPLPEVFVRFLGLAETLGAIGLILPGLLRIRTGLTALAASGLVIIMMGATVLTPTLLGMDVIMALPNVVIGVLAAAIAYSRWQVAPLKRR
jgi:DoxX-like family